MKHARLPILAVLLLAPLAAGCADAEPGTEEETDIDGLSKALAEASEAVREALGSAGSVDFRELRDLLPDEVSHLEQTERGGERVSVLGMSFSHASATYEDDRRSIEISISDLGTLSAVVAAGTAAWLDAEIDRESQSGYERTRKVRRRGKTYPAYERFEVVDGRGECEIQVWAADRFMVGIEGDGVEMGQCDDVLDEISFRRLEKLGDRARERGEKGEGGP